VRGHDVTSLTDTELEHARRGLVVSLGLVMAGSPVRIPISAQMDAVEAELRLRMREQATRLCGCGFAVDDPKRMTDHFAEYPSHSERFPWWGLVNGSHMNR
jgi:hypothetical protein